MDGPLTVGELIAELEKHSPLLPVWRDDTESLALVWGARFDADKMCVVIQ